MLVAAAVCPSPPILVPVVAAGAARELDDLRQACDRAVAGVLAAGPDLMVLLGTGSLTRSYGSGAVGSLAGFGVDVTVALGPRRAGGPVLPPSLTVGAWLLGRSGWTGDVQGLALASDTASADCATPAADLRALPGRVGLLVLAEGSATRTDKAPGAFHPDAETFDAALADALEAPDPAALAALDERRAAEVWAAGRAPLAVLGHAATGSDWEAQVLHASAPYGVGYLVAAWTARETARVGGAGAFPAGAAGG